MSKERANSKYHNSNGPLVLSLAGDRNPAVAVFQWEVDHPSSCLAGGGFHDPLYAHAKGPSRVHLGDLFDWLAVVGFVTITIWSVVRGHRARQTEKTATS